MTRGGRQKNREDGPERRCIATGESRPARGLIRFVVGPDAQIVPDIVGRLPGRGIWVAADRAALDRAVGKKLFARAARAPVTLPDGLVALVEAQLARRVIDLLSLARKGGQAVAGYEKVRDLALKGDMIVLVQASDGSERGKTKLRPPDTPGGHVTCLRAEEIGQAFGRDHVVHAALGTGGLAKAVVEEAARLDGLRHEPGGYATPKDKTDA